MHISQGGADSAPSALSAALTAQRLGDDGSDKLDGSSSHNGSSSSGNCVLLLCYPPPGCDMALDALKSHRGEWVVHVGEWGGLTGSAQFENELRQQFEPANEKNGLPGRAAECPLPSWGTDVASLTVWRRKTPNRMVASSSSSSNRGNNSSHAGNDRGDYGLGSTQGPPYLVPCASCGARATLRCRFARRLALCGTGSCPGFAQGTAATSRKGTFGNTDGALHTAVAPALTDEEVRRRVASELALQMLHVPSEGQTALTMQRQDHFIPLHQPA